MLPANKKKTRLLHIDWARGLAVLMMIRGHVVNAFLASRCRQEELFHFWQYLGGYTAPVFIFVAGVCLGISFNKLNNPDIPFQKKLWLSVKRGFEVLGFAFLLRIIQYVQWIPYSKTEDIFKVDILNNIGLSLIFLGIVYTISINNKIRLAVFSLLTIITGMFTNTLWNCAFFNNIPQFIRDYFIATPNEFGHFPVFPYFGFITSGAIIGIILAGIREKPDKIFRLHAGLSIIGIIIIIIAKISVTLPHPEGWNYWNNSPELIFTRISAQFLIISACYFICLHLKSEGFSFMRIMGRHSLLIYIVHVCIVYGRPCTGLQQTLGWSWSIMGIFIVAALMVLMVWLWEKRTIKIRLTKQGVSNYC